MHKLTVLLLFVALFLYQVSTKPSEDDHKALDELIGSKVAETFEIRLKKTTEMGKELYTGFQKVGVDQLVQHRIKLKEFKAFKDFLQKLMKFK